MFRSRYLEWVKQLEESMPEDSAVLSGSAMAPPRQLMREILDTGPLQREFDRSAPRAEWGHPALFSQLERLYGVGPSRTVLTGGASLAIYTVCHAFLVPGSTAIVERPTYEPYLVACKSAGAKCVTWNRRADTLEALLRKHPGGRMIVMSNLHNPTGAFSNAEEIRQIGDIARRHKCLLLVDEVFRDLGPSEHGLPKPAAFEASNIISINGLSKVFGLGALRIAWIFASEAYTARIRMAQASIENIGSRLTQALAARFLNHAPAQLQHNIRLLRRNWSCAAKIFAGTPFAPPDDPLGTIYFPKVGDADTLVARLAKKKVFVVPGRFFGTPDRIRIGIGGFDGPVARLEAALTTIRREAEKL